MPWICILRLPRHLYYEALKRLHSTVSKPKLHNISILPRLASEASVLICVFIKVVDLRHNHHPTILDGSPSYKNTLSSSLRRRHLSCQWCHHHQYWHRWNTLFLLMFWIVIWAWSVACHIATAAVASEFEKRWSCLNVIASIMKDRTADSNHSVI